MIGLGNGVVLRPADLHASELESGDLTREYCQMTRADRIQAWETRRGSLPVPAISIRPFQLSFFPID